ncbi:MAG: hypothetical protein ACRDSE_16970, partial [Pseudonocardiaceae bacterium]
MPENRQHPDPSPAATAAALRVNTAGAGHRPPNAPCGRHATPGGHSRPDRARWPTWTPIAAASAATATLVTCGTSGMVVVVVRPERYRDPWFN